MTHVSKIGMEMVYSADGGTGDDGSIALADVLLGFADHFLPHNPVGRWTVCIPGIVLYRARGDHQAANAGSGQPADNYGHHIRG